MIKSNIVAKTQALTQHIGSSFSESLPPDESNDTKVTTSLTPNDDLERAAFAVLRAESDLALVTSMQSLSVSSTSSAASKMKEEFSAKLSVDLSRPIRRLLIGFRLFVVLVSSDDVRIGADIARTRGGRRSPLVDNMLLLDWKAALRSVADKVGLTTASMEPFGKSTLVETL